MELPDPHLAYLLEVASEFHDPARQLHRGGSASLVERDIPVQLFFPFPSLVNFQSLAYVSVWDEV